MWAEFIGLLRRPALSWPCRYLCHRDGAKAPGVLMGDISGFQLTAAGLRPSNSCSWPS